MQAPNIANLFLACVPKFFFDNGSGERNLGMVEKPPDVEPKSTDVEIYNSQEGILWLAKVLNTKRQVLINLILQEAVAASMQAFFLGGPLEMVGAGTAALVDQLLTLKGTLLASLAGKYGLTAVTVRQFLDKCFLFDASAGEAGEFVDNSLEADILAGSAFPTLEDGDDLLYLAKATPFKQVYFDLAVPGSYGAVVVKYWNGAEWSAVSGLAGAGDALGSDGKMSWNLPTDWAMTTVNGYTGYFIQISATTPWTTPATVNCIRQNAVQNTDYILDPGAVTPELLVGRVGRLAAGFLADGEEVKVSFTHSTWTALEFPVATENYVEGSARLEFRPVDGPWWNFIISRCQLKPNGKLTFDQEKPMEVPMTLLVLGDPNNPTAPCGRWQMLNET